MGYLALCLYVLGCFSWYAEFEMDYKNNYTKKQIIISSLLWPLFGALMAIMLLVAVMRALK